MGNPRQIDLGGMDIIANSFRPYSTRPAVAGTRFFFANGSTPASINTAGNATYTAANLLTGIIVRDCNGAGRSDTLDTAAAIVAAVKAVDSGVNVGDIVCCDIINGSAGATNITLGAGTGGAFDANQTSGSRTVIQNTSKTISIRLTNVTAGSEAYVVYV
jgi:hypothetical protein